MAHIITRNQFRRFKSKCGPVAVSVDNATVGHQISLLKIKVMPKLVKLI